MSPTATTPDGTTARRNLATFADGLLAATAAYASPGHARITLPGAPGGFGRDVDGLEGFARTFLLAGFRLAGERGADPTGLAERYARGLAAGSDPGAPDRWVRLTEHPQAKVEAASLALVLDLTRPWIWDRLTPRVQDQLVAYLAPAVGDDTYPPTNWVWFRLVVQTFLRSVGGPHDLGEMRADLAAHDTFARADGWCADGPERAFDHYNGWALHLYPALWARMAGAGDLAAPRRAGDVAALDRYLLDARALVGGDGGPLVQGRSLVYRFAAAAPFWAGALAGVPGTSPGALRTAALAVVGYFRRRGVPDARGLLTLGWTGPFPPLAQAYSGPGSPYWAVKGLLGLALPADHPVWTDPPEPLPVRHGDTLRAVRAPGWLVSGTRDDGIVRVVNHGTDHAAEGAPVGDSPLYARLGYSTATSPLLDDAAWTDPADQSVALLDADGRASHRAGMRTLDVRVDGPGDDGARSRPAAARVGYGASVADAHWLTPDAAQDRFGSGWTGAVRPAGRVTVHSVVRGPWEVRVVDVARPAPEAVALRVGGWPVAGDAPEGSTADGAATARSDRLVSRVEVLVGHGTPGVLRAVGASPLGPVALVPAVDLRPVPDGPVAVLLTLTGGDAGNPVPHHGAGAGGGPGAAAGPGTPPAPAASASASVDLVASAAGTSLRVTWPDGVRTRTVLAAAPPAGPGGPAAPRPHPPQNRSRP